jgi:hypothetical protein
MITTIQNLYLTIKNNQLWQQRIKTPGVYIEEIVKFPPSVAQVETAPLPFYWIY